MTKKSNATIWLILLICLAPFLASVLLYFFWTPSKFLNYGELIEPKPFDSYFSGSNVAISDLLAKSRGKWAFVIFKNGSCDEDCQRNLYWLRQVRIAQGRERDRLKIIWVIPDGVASAQEMIKSYPSVTIVDLKEINVEIVLDSIHEVLLLDPFGNLVMGYPRDFDPELIKTDIKKLLKVSKATKFKNAN